MTKLWVMCGVPGTGKSTWIKNNLSKFEGEVEVVSRDEIRFSMVAEGEEYFSKEDEVFKEFINRIKAALDTKDNVIVDATHLNVGSRSKLLRALGRSLRGVEVNAIVLRADVNFSLERNENRKDTRAYVPKSVIRRMSSQFTMPEFEEGFTNIHVCLLTDTGEHWSVFRDQEERF